MQELSSIIFNSLSDGLFLALSTHATESVLFLRLSKWPGIASLWTHSLRGTLRKWALSSASEVVNHKFTPSAPKPTCFPTAHLHRKHIHLLVYFNEATLPVKSLDTYFWIYDFSFIFMALCIVDDHRRHQHYGWTKMIYMFKAKKKCEITQQQVNKFYSLEDQE